VQISKRVIFGPLLVILALAVAVGLGACGSSSNSSSSGGSSSTASSSGAASSGAAASTGASSSSSGAATGSPVKIGLIASGTGITAQPAVYQAAQVGAAAANAAGGLMGHKIQIDYCDDQSSLQTAAVCAQKLLVQDKDLFLAGDDGSWETTVLPVVDAHHSLWWNGEGASLPVYSDPNVFFSEPEIASFNEMPSLIPKTQKIGYFVADIAVAVKDAQLTVPLYKAQGDTFTSIPVPLAASSFSSPCLQAKNAGVQYAIASFNAAAQFAPMSQACNQLGINPTWVLEGSVLGPAVFSTISQLKLKNLLVLPLSPKGINSMLADEKTYGPTIVSPYDDAAQMAYMAYKTLPLIVKGAGSLDPTAIKAWLSKQTALNLDGFVPPVNYTAAYQPFGKAVGRIKNTCVYTYTADGDGVKPLGTAPHCFKATS
jgi:hypothetical protein